MSINVWIVSALLTYLFCCVIVTLYLVQQCMVLHGNLSVRDVVLNALISLLCPLWLILETCAVFEPAFQCLQRKTGDWWNASIWRKK